MGRGSITYEEVERQLSKLKAIGYVEKELYDYRYSTVIYMRETSLIVRLEKDGKKYIGKIQRNRNLIDDKHEFRLTKNYIGSLSFNTNVLGIYIEGCYNFEESLAQVYMIPNGIVLVDGSPSYLWNNEDKIMLYDNFTKDCSNVSLYDLDNNKMYELEQIGIYNHNKSKAYFKDCVDLSAHVKIENGKAIIESMIDGGVYFETNVVAERALNSNICLMKEILM
jgi:hypothetical protein